ncbi:MAG: hypothetical protein CVU42_11165 [Chloroflexi bacterium HGW-Chloroflexi-4]|nr:MAG: hypothetical protein CVU42_11165 [Chloroflexi bacterium HGW-Chloroflexi-4]
MKTHTEYEEMLPFYAAGGCTSQQKREMEAHINLCHECQTELTMWKAVSMEIDTSNKTISTPSDIPAQALTRIRASKPMAAAIRQSWQLLKAQTYLIQSELWPVSALVMLIGVLVAVIARKDVVVYLLSPMMAAATLSMLYGPDHDPANELTRSTATSPWKILLARMSIMSCYNLLLGLIASLGLLFIVKPEMLGTIILGWVGPLAFLSSLALLLSVWWGTGIAIAVTYGLWLAQYISFKSIGILMPSPVWSNFLTEYKNFWHEPLLLVGLAFFVALAALWSANLPMLRLSSSIQ